MAENSNGNGGTAPHDSGSGDSTTGSDEDTANVRSPQQTRLSDTELLSSQEMMDAEPVDLPEIEDEEGQAAMPQHADDVPEGPGEGEGVSPAAQPTEDTEQAADLETQAGFGYPAPYTTHPVITEYKTFPYRAVGRLFMKTDQGWGACTAASIGNNAIWTAGHCIHDGGNGSDGWVDEVIFVPAYKDGNAPFGQWQGKYKITRGAWYNNGSLCEDMGAVVLQEKDGRQLQEVVGNLGFAWHWGRVKQWHAMGYPARDPFDGSKMIETDASYAYNGSLSCSPQTVAIGSNQTKGCSGGPWIWRFGGGTYVYGHNSYRWGSRDEEIKSPYFGSAAKSLFQATR